MSSRYLHWKIVALRCAACVGLLALSGCDGRSAAPPLPLDPSAVPQSKAAASGASVKAAPTPSAVSPSQGSMDDAQRMRIPYVPRQDEAALSGLVPYVGAYPHDGVNYLTTGVLAERLQSLLGSQYRLLLQNLATSGPLTEEGSVWSLIGLRPHEGRSEAAAIVVDPQRDGLRVWLFSEGKEMVFTDVDEPDIAWPPQVQKTIRNAAQKMKNGG